MNIILWLIAIEFVLLIIICLIAAKQLKSLKQRMNIDETANTKSFKGVYQEQEQLHVLYGFLTKTSNRKVRRLWARTLKNFELRYRSGTRKYDQKFQEIMKGVDEE